MPSQSPNEARDVAIELIRRGWQPVPIPRGKKAPVLARWQHLRLTEADVGRLFEEGQNIGVLTGGASGGLIDVDLDCDEAVVLAPAFLPSTRMRSGRPSRPKSHRWYIVDTVPEYTVFKEVDDDATTLLELRGDGHQTIVPPSLHPEGEIYTWHGPLEPAHTSGEELEQAFRRVGAATLLTRHWPKEPGSRHDIANALAGMLIRSGWSEEDTAHFVRSVAAAASDEEASERARAAVATARALADGRRATGTPTLTSLLDQCVVDRVRDWLQLRPTLSAFRSFTAYRLPNSSAWPDPLGDAAYYGLAGDFVRLVEPHTEADPVALLVQFIIGFGNLVGRGPHFRAEADQHYPNLFGAFVGVSSKARKGTSKGHVDRIFRALDEGWARDRQQGGLSSGEGLIWAVRDPIWTRSPVRKGGRVIDYEEAESDPGVADKRLLVFEPELASALRVLGREGNTLSAMLRQAWDTGVLRTLTKNTPAKATGAHISIIGHITRDELRRYLTRTEIGNGFANRFLWICVKRARVLPEGGNISRVDFAPLLRDLSESIQHVQSLGQIEIQRDKGARALWCEVYPKLSEGSPGFFGAVTSRAEAQVMRLALVYALLDRSGYITRGHLAAALATWAYAEASSRHIFGDGLGEPMADETLRALRDRPDGMTRTQIRDVFKRNRSSNEINRALELLLAHGLARVVSEPTGGRPVERWFPVAQYAVNDQNDPRSVDEETSVVNVVNVVPQEGSQGPPPGSNEEVVL